MPDPSYDDLMLQRSLDGAGITSGEVDVHPQGPVNPSETAGGAWRLDNTDSTGSGATFYTNRGADAQGRLIMVKDVNAANPQTSVRVEKAGTGFAVGIEHTGSGGNGGALDVVSTNKDCSSVGIEGQEENRGTAKITHVKPAGVADGNASALSLRCNGNGTAAQGIFLDCEDGGTTGKLLNLRNVGEKFVVHSQGAMEVTEQAEPAAPAADKAIIWIEDNGAGKTRLMVKFNTGVKQQIAIQP